MDSRELYKEIKKFGHDKYVEGFNAGKTAAIRAIQERIDLPYDAMGDYAETSYSTGTLSPDSWYTDEFWGGVVK